MDQDKIYNKNIEIKNIQNGKKINSLILVFSRLGELMKKLKMMNKTELC